MFQLMSSRLVQRLLQASATAVTLAGAVLLVLSLSVMENLFGFSPFMGMVFFNVGFWVLIGGLGFWYFLLE